MFAGVLYRYRLIRASPISPAFNLLLFAIQDSLFQHQRSAQGEFENFLFDVEGSPVANSMFEIQYLPPVV